tara:strand:- start:1193 stop:1753 length:561 start_codon:yes stop_codon:yes gene_type:complete
LKPRKYPLTSKQKQFVSEYLIDRNAKQAAIRSGYSVKTAEVQGSRLLSNVKVKALVEKKTKIIEEKTDLTALKAMEEVKAIATSNIMDGMEYDANTREFSFKAPDEVPAEFWKAAQEVTVYSLPNGGGMATKVKMYNKTPALKMEYERHGLNSPGGTTNNIANVHFNFLALNKARRRAGIEEIEEP